MKFIEKFTKEVREGRPAGEEKPACIVFYLLDEHGREFSYIHKLSKRKYTEGEIEAALEGVSNSFKVWAAKKLLDYEELNKPFMAKKKKLPKLGSGKRFANLKADLSKKKGIKDPGALAAAIGRKKFGNKKMTSLAKAGKKRR